MGEKYFVPPAFQLTDSGLVSVFWDGDNYFVFDGCVDRSNGSTLDFIKVSPWGYTLDVGSTFLSSGTKLSETDSCPDSDSRISIISPSNSLMDTPNFSPYEPFYFLGFLALSVYIFILAFKMLFGRMYR